MRTDEMKKPDETMRPDETTGQGAVLRPTLQEVREHLQLAPLPQEGGLYRQTYVSATGTAIYYLLDDSSFSHFHRLAYDEVYHFYLGDPLCLWELLPGGGARCTVLGSRIHLGEQVQHVVPAGSWQGSCRLAALPEDALAYLRHCAPPGQGKDLGYCTAPGQTAGCGALSGGTAPYGYSLLGTTMSPGYTPECYEHGNAEALLKEYPDAGAVIRALCSS